MPSIDAVNKMNPVWPDEIPHPEECVRVALVGAGNRSQTIYVPLFEYLAPWFKVVAVCDPVKENCDAVAAQLGVRAYYDLRELVHDCPMEAAITITPAESHHSVSVYLSEHGVHNMVETPFAATLKQARQMCGAAEKHGVILRVAENFIRLPEYRIAAAVRDSNVIGPIKRIVSYNAHTGYHNNSVWIHFAGRRLPQWVQSIEHTVPTTPYNLAPHTRRTVETYRAHFYQFPDNLLVVDHAANLKGRLGRLRRQGYAEWQGTRGTLTHGSIAYPGGSTAEVRRLSDDSVRRGQAAEPFTGRADESWPVVHEYTDDHRWFRSYVDVGAEHVEYTNPFRPRVKLRCYAYREGRREGYQDPFYAGVMMDLLVDFALALRGLRASEYLPEHALWAMMMMTGAAESAIRDGGRIALPIQGEPEADVRAEEQIRKKHGVDACDVEAMLALNCPKP